jgi:hypothetical protein
LLRQKGCKCCSKWKFWTDGEKVNVNWIGLFDAVDMTTSIKIDNDFKNVGHIYHEIKSEKQLIFPTLPFSPNTNGYKETSFLNTLHGDIGTDMTYLNGMIRDAESHGLYFNWNNFITNAAENVINKRK